MFRIPSNLIVNIIKCLNGPVDVRSILSRKKTKIQFLLLKDESGNHYSSFGFDLFCENFGGVDLIRMRRPEWFPDTVGERLTVRLECSNKMWGNLRSSRPWWLTFPSHVDIYDIILTAISVRQCLFAFDFHFRWVINSLVVTYISVESIFYSFLAARWLKCVSYENSMKTKSLQLFWRTSAQIVIIIIFVFSI